MIALAQDMLRKVDTISQSSDEASALLIDQMRMIDKQIGLDEKGLELTQAELAQITEDAKGMMRGLLQFNGTLVKSKQVLVSKQESQQQVVREMERVRNAENRYKMSPDKSNGHRSTAGFAALAAFTAAAVTAPRWP